MIIVLNWYLMQGTSFMYSESIAIVVQFFTFIDLLESSSGLAYIYQANLQSITPKAFISIGHYLL